MDRKDKDGWLLVALVVLAMAGLLWLLSMDSVQAQGLCPAGETESPGHEPLAGENGQCRVCCVRNGGAYWHRVADWHPVCYPSRSRPTATPRPTSTRRPALPPPPPAPPEDATPAPPGYGAPVPEETPTRTATPDAPALPGESTPIASPPAPSATSAGIAATSTARTAANTRLGCIPRHAARPIALCDSGSDSGWWLYFVGPGGRIKTGPHVPYPSPALAGRHLVLRHYISGEPIWLVWHADRLQVRTGYAGKAYVFSVTRDGRVRHEAW